MLSKKKPKLKNNFYDDSYVLGYSSREVELKNRFKQHLSRIEKYKHGGRLLDIGSGMGYFIEVVEQSRNYPWRTTGLEFVKNLITRANVKLRDRIIQGSMSKLPFKDNTFDCITCFDVLEHGQNLQMNLLQIKRVLKKKGILVIQAPNYKSLMTFLTGKKWDWWAPPDHELHFSFDFLVNYLKQNDFEILEQFTHDESKDFLLNVKGRAGKNFFFKALFYLFVPLLLILERISWLLNLGGLSFIVAEKK
ncbi:class I SAM-dependent methyltransferase [Candidatus Gottesmanbacteria bacterium]|nr:class I SAM-dependent methyltransferase [Candidatus Gottesmanbacteria bacterium]